MRVLVNNIILNYEQIGEGDKNLIILHGWGCSSREWISVAQKMEKYKVTILDLPGFGLSEEPHNSLNIFEYAEIVSIFLNKIGINNCIIMGHSFGGRIGTILSSKNPTIVDKLILIDSGGIEIKSLKIKIKIILSKLLKPLKIFFPQKLRKMFGSSDYRAISGVLRESFIKIINQDLRYLFSKINIPVVVIWGSNDQVLPVSYVKIYRSLIPNTNIRIVWEADHFPHLSKPENFIQILKEEL